MWLKCKMSVGITNAHVDRSRPQLLQVSNILFLFCCLLCPFACSNLDGLYTSVSHTGCVFGLGAPFRQQLENFDAFFFPTHCFVNNEISLLPPPPKSPTFVQNILMVNNNSTSSCITDKKIQTSRDIFK